MDVIGPGHTTPCDCIYSLSLTQRQREQHTYNESQCVNFTAALLYICLPTLRRKVTEVTEPSEITSENRGDQNSESKNNICGQSEKGNCGMLEALIT